MKHEAVHVGIGLTWFGFVRSSLGEIPLWYALIAMFASLLPDMEHAYYLFISKQKNSQYSSVMKKLFYERRFIELCQYAEKQHKKQVFLRFHHLGVVILFTILTIWSFQKEHQFLSLLYGSVLSHYLFDIIDDIFYLRKLNPNWVSGLIRRKEIMYDKAN